MSVFDIAAQATGMQGAASAVATSLVPRRHAASQAVGDAVPGKVEPHASSGSSGSTSSTGGATITSSDFLTLLVSELKNQDPTQPTDPNAYIQQLVGVNSLQQLIQINQGISSIGSGTKTTTGHAVSGSATQV